MIENVKMLIARRLASQSFIHKALIQIRSREIEEL